MLGSECGARLDGREKVMWETVAGVEVPSTDELVGSWKIDPAHSSVEFSVKHMMISTVRGRFGQFEGSFTIDADPARSSAEVTIDSASIDTREADRDAHLKSPDFLEVARYPEIRFRGSGAEIVSEEEGTFRITGRLTIRDVTLPITLEGSLNGLMHRDLSGRPRVSFTASAVINRKDYGLTWNRAIETDGVLVGDRITIVLEVAGVKQDR